MALLTFQQFLNESKEEGEKPSEDESRVKAKYQDLHGTIAAIDYTSSGQQDLIEFSTKKGHKKMVPKRELELLDND